MTVEQIIALANALQPFIAPATVGVETIIGAIRGAGGLSEDQIDADLQALIIEALDAKKIADAAAAGQDPQ